MKESNNIFMNIIVTVIVALITMYGTTYILDKTSINYLFGYGHILRTGELIQTCVEIPKTYSKLQLTAYVNSSNRCVVTLEDSSIETEYYQLFSSKEELDSFLRGIRAMHNFNLRFEFHKCWMENGGAKDKSLGERAMVYTKCSKTVGMID